MKLSIVLSTQPARFQAATFRGDLEANIRRIATIGYDGVELAIRDSARIELDQIESLVREHHLSVSAIGTGQAWGEEGLSFTDSDPAVRRAAIERIQGHISLAARFQAVIIIGLIRGTLQPDVTPEQAREWLLTALRACCQSAWSQGVHLALEPINRYETSLINTAAQALELVEQVGMDNFGLLLDTFHMNIEEAVIENSIRLCQGHIYHFHVADSNRWRPGAGHLNFQSILSALFATGYSGYVSGEFLPMPNAENAARESVDFLRGLALSS